MIGDVIVMTPGRLPEVDGRQHQRRLAAQNGERLFASLGCNSCHSGEADARGPNLAAVYGTKLQLANGCTGACRRRLSARHDPESLACT